MTELSTNPYRPPSAEETTASPYRRLTRLLLILVGLVLMYRGLLLVYSFTHVYVLQGFPSDSFYHSLMAKDAVYGLTALAGSSVVAFPSRIGWFFATAHWLWSITGDVVIVLCAATFSWVFPPQPNSVQLSLVCILGMIGLMILLWKPVMDRCGVHIRRLRLFAALFSGELALGLLLNWLALSRLW